MKTTIFFIIFICTCAKAQTPVPKDSPGRDTEDSSRIIGHVYHVNAWGSIAITAVGEGAVIIAQHLFSKPDITNAEFDVMQTDQAKQSLNVFDRWALRLGRPSVDYTWTAVGIQAVSAAAPLALLFGERYRKNWDDLILMMMETNTIATCMFQFSPFGPYFQNRFRPIIYYATDSATRFAEKSGGNRNSMFSGHTISATASLYLMAKVYCDYNPHIEGWDKIGIYALASIPPLIMGYYRVIALRHFPSDVLVGGILGGIIGIVIPELHRIPDKTVSFGAYSSPTSTGINIAWNLK
jgi:hypothetical protein